jgi:hypothetical protein
MNHKRWLSVFIVGVLAMEAASRADQLGAWVLRNPQTTDADLWSVACGKGTYVVAGMEMLASTDLTNWVKSPYRARSVAYGDGRFVAVGYERSLVSHDGL